MTKNFNEYAQRIHKLNHQWWHDQFGNRLDRNPGELLMLVVTELAEGVEGLRKNLMDDHLPHRKMIEVELADAMIRLFDFAGGFGYDIETGFNFEIETNNEAEIILRATKLVTDIYYAIDEDPFDKEYIEDQIIYALDYIISYAEKFGYDVWGALEEKLEYNQKRADHKIENRLKEGGKKF